MIVRDKSNLFAILFAWQGTILPKVLPALIGVIAISAFLVYLSTQHLLTVPAVPTIGFTIFGIIVSIFLSFRNNACYDRWWEGRKLWGALIANSRHISRDSHVLDDAHRRQMMHRVMLFSRLLRDRLRKHDFVMDASDKKAGFSADIFEDFKHNINSSQYVLEQIQKDLVKALKRGEISDIIYSTLNKHIVELGNIQAGCDRIVTTPLPFAYSVLLHRTVYCFCLILPFSLASSLGLWTPVLVGLIAYLFLGLDALSSELEEPFGLQENDLPLDSIVRLIEREMLSSLGEQLPAATGIHKHNLS